VVPTPSSWRVAPRGPVTYDSVSPTRDSRAGPQVAGGASLGRSWSGPSTSPPAARRPRPPPSLHGPLAHLPSGRFAANPAWLACAAIAHNLTRAAGALAGSRHARTRTGTVRRQLIHTPARIAHSAHRQVLHLPRDWPWEPGLDELLRRALHDPLPTAA
jgi:hypothetical protein